MRRLRAVRAAGLVALVSLAALVVAATVLAGADVLYYRERLYPGTILGTIPLGGLKMEEALALLEERLFSAGELTLVLGGEEPRVYPLAGLGIAWDREETVRRLEAAGRGWPGLEARLGYWRHGAPLEVPAGFRVDDVALDLALAELAAALHRPPRTASFEIRGAEVRVIPEEAGRFLEAGLLRERIFRALERGCPHDPVAIPVAVLPAFPTAEQLAGYGVQEVMALFSTDVAGSIAERVHNIGLGAAAIHGILLAPGEEFSFNRVVGSSTREKGYREAPIIIGDRLVPGLGGGLCQVSSTLYNAALLANLSITERYNHSLTVAYLPPGRDATVSYDHLDLKFTNNHIHHILIGAELEGERLVFRIFGLHLEERVEIISSGLRRIEAPVQHREAADLPAGTREMVQEGKAGYSVTTWRVFFRGEEEVHREKLSTDYYRPIPYIYRVGPGPGGSGEEQR